MKISYKNDNNHIFIEISTQELEESGIDIHSLLSICEYPTEKNLNDTLKLRSNINLSNFFVSSVFFINNRIFFSSSVYNFLKFFMNNNS